jgi:site-specific recombinase XerD
VKLLEATELYVTTSGRINTDQSRTRVRATARQLAHYCGNRLMTAYTVDDLTGFCLGHGGRGTAPNSIGSRVSIIRPLFDWCTWQKIIRTNPASSLKYTVKVKRANVREHTWLTEGEVIDIGRSFNLEDPFQHRDYIVFRTTVMLGIRRSEVAQFRWDSFRRGMTEVSFIGKGGKPATLPILPGLRADLETWRRMQPPDSVPWPAFHCKLVKGLVIDPAAKATPMGRKNLHHEMTIRWAKPLAADGIYELVKRIANAHGVTSLAPHDLRRSFAGILEAKGVELREIQALMRHEQLATTDRYMERNPARLAKAIEGITWGK